MSQIKVNFEEVDQQVKKGIKARFEQAKKDLFVAEQQLDYATTDSHYDLLCDNLIVAKSNLDIAYRTFKMTGGVSIENLDCNNNGLFNRLRKLCKR